MATVIENRDFRARDRHRRYRARVQELGFVQKAVWIHVTEKEAFDVYVKSLQRPPHKFKPTNTG